MAQDTVVKIFRYKIKAGTEAIYLQLQKQAQALYQDHAKVEFMYLKDANDFLLRTEVIRYFDANPFEVIKQIDSDPRILDLFKRFEQTILDTSSPIHEETLKRDVI